MADEEIDTLLEEAITKPSKDLKSTEKRHSNSRHVRRRDRSRRRQDSRDDKRHSRRRRRSVIRSRSRRRDHHDTEKDSRRDRSRHRPRKRSYSRESNSSTNYKDRRSRERNDTIERNDERDSKRRSSRSNSKSSSKYRKRSQSRGKETRKPSTSAERAERSKKKELMELTRDHRTVFIGQLQKKVTERDLEKFFKQVGKVEHVLLIRDKFTNRSKGFAYVEMSNLDDIPKILSLNGQIPTFQVFPILVKASEAEKNFTARKEAEASAAYLQYLNANGTGAGGANTADSLIATSGYSSLSAASRIYCGNLHTNVTEDDLRVIFQTFGTVTNVNINRDEMGRSKGFGFIQFQTPREANLALSKGNGIELAGNYLKLGCVNESTTSSTANISGYNVSTGSWKLEDDDEGCGFTMNALSRTQLMAKLAGGTGAEFIQEQQAKKAALAASASANDNKGSGTAPSNIPISTNPEGSDSFCFVIKNMYDPSSSDAILCKEIQEDVEEECKKYGNVLHCNVAQHMQGGLVYLLFDNIKSAVNAAKVLHGRWFNCRQIGVRYLSSQEYVGMFPQCRSIVQEIKAKNYES